jgi:hypothetical protein
VDVRDLDRIDVGMLFIAVGDQRRVFVSIILRAIIEERGLDLQIVRDGRGYAVIGIETVGGDAVVAEHRLPVAWPDIDEDVRFFILGLYVEGLLDGHVRWLRRHRPRLGMVVANDGSSQK